MNNKPIFVDTRFCHNDKNYAKNITLERLYKCPKCNAHIFKNKLFKYKKCPDCGLKFDLKELI